MTSGVYVRTPEHCAKISAAKRGKPSGREGTTWSPEQREKLKGPLSVEHKRKISEALKGCVRSPDTRAKIREALKGRSPSIETRAKMSAAQTGKRVSEETRQRLSEALVGRLVTEETRHKISKAKRGKFCGPDSPRWRGGTSFGPYCFRFNSEFKERVREFFGRRCAECGAPEGDRRHFVHHVNYRKDSCCAEDAPPLFVPLCHSCHPKTNHNREFWEARFTALINEQYGGRCYLPRADCRTSIEETA